MKVNISDIDTEQFNVTSEEIAGETCYLVNPKTMGCEWTKENTIYRSSLWNSQGELISASFKKFTNIGERPSIFPDPVDLKNATIVEKIDGSALILSRYNGQTICRTRGTFDATNLENGHEIELLKQKYPLVWAWIENNSLLETSLIFEWVTPNNKIVLDYGQEPQLFLIGQIYHDDYRYVSQQSLDELAIEINVPRPQTHTFPSLKDVLEEVPKWQGKEGVCIYFHDNQQVKKLKSLHYLKLHAFKSEISLNSLLDLYFEYGKPNYVNFLDSIRRQFDWECAQEARSIISKISDAVKEVNNIIDGMIKFTLTLRNMTRKEQAEKILSSYGQTNRASYVFNLLDGKPLKDDQIKKLLWQVLK